MHRLPEVLATLKLDVDRKRRPSRVRLRRLLVRAGYKVLSLGIRQSPSGRGWHVRIRVSPHPRTPLEVIALQAILGSDPKREAMNLVRARVFWRTPAFARSWFNVLYTTPR